MSALFVVVSSDLCVKGQSSLLCVGFCFLSTDIGGGWDLKHSTATFQTCLLIIERLFQADLVSLICLFLIRMKCVLLWFSKPIQPTLMNTSLPCRCRSGENLSYWVNGRHGSGSCIEHLTFRSLDHYSTLFPTLFIQRSFLPLNNFFPAWPDWKLTEKYAL